MFVCVVAGCDKTFSQAKDLERHTQEIHSGIRFYCCYPGCKSKASCDGLARESNVSRHIVSQHKVNTPGRYVARQ